MDYEQNQSRRCRVWHDRAEAGGRRCDAADEVHFTGNHVFGDHVAVGGVVLRVLEIDGQVFAFHQAALFKPLYKAVVAVIQGGVRGKLDDADPILFPAVCLACLPEAEELWPSVPAHAETETASKAQSAADRIFLTVFFMIENLQNFILMVLARPARQ